jgi:hypothetical protein
MITSKQHKALSKALGSVIITSNPTGINYWYDLYKQYNMTRIYKCVFMADSISLHIIDTTNTTNALERLCYIGAVQYENGFNGYAPYFKITLTSLRDMNRLIPQLKKMFPHDKHMKDEYVHTMRQFFGEV